MEPEHTLDLSNLAGYIHKLRALCPHCKQAVGVRISGKRARMVAHTRSGTMRNRWQAVSCHVATVDAWPLIRPWLMRRLEEEGHSISHTQSYLADLAERTRKAEEQLQNSVALRTLAELLLGAFDRDHPMAPATPDTTQQP